MNDFALEQIEKGMRVQDIFARRCIKAAVFGHCAVGVKMKHKKFDDDFQLAIRSNWINSHRYPSSE